MLGTEHEAVGITSSDVPTIYLCKGVLQIDPLVKISEKDGLPGATIIPKKELLEGLCYPRVRQDAAYCIDVLLPKETNRSGAEG